MAKKSAGILLFRLKSNLLQVFLVHPGGPYFQKKDTGSWSIPKGEISESEDPLEAAKREFCEETGFNIEGVCIPLSPIRQKSGKIVYPWAVKGNIDETKIRSDTFQLEWPPRSGKFNEYPEIDRGEWFDITTAKTKILPAQVSILEELMNGQPSLPSSDL
ncbi:MAG: NUDIX domain-containing protein [Chitinophagaceae bacterium]